MADGYSNLDIVSDFGIRISDLNVAISLIISHLIFPWIQYRSRSGDPHGYDTGGVYHRGFESANPALFDRRGNRKDSAARLDISNRFCFTKRPFPTIHHNEARVRLNGSQ